MLAFFILQAISAYTRYTMSIKFGEMVKSFEDQATSGDFMVWIEKLELVAKLKEVAELQTLLPLFLSGPAFAVYSQLSDEEKGDYEMLKIALISAFCISPFSAYNELRGRTLQIGESPDVYVADLKRLIVLIGCKEVPEELLRCAFMGGLPASVRMQLTAMSEAATMPMPALIARARVVLSAGVKVQDQPCAGGSASIRQVKCYKCGQSGHIPRSCRSTVKCFACQGMGHFARDCPRRQGNGTGAESSVVPDSTPTTL